MSLSERSNRSTFAWSYSKTKPALEKKAQSRCLICCNDSNTCVARRRSGGFTGLHGMFIEKGTIRPLRNADER